MPQELIHVKPTTRRTRHGLVHVRGYTKIVHLAYGRRVRAPARRTRARMVRRRRVLY